jgi:hypothetical protein
MCEHVQEIAEASIRNGARYPVDVEEHLQSCAACSQHIALVSLIATTGRPSVQLPPVELTDRIASLTFAKQSTWQTLFAKPAVFVPALGLVAAAGWLISGLGDVDKVARVDATSQPVNNPLVVSAPTQSDNKNIKRVPSVNVSPQRNVATNSVTPSEMVKKARQNVKLAYEITSGNPVADPEPAVTILQKPQSIAPEVKTSEIAIATQSASRVPEIITSTAQNISVQVPSSTRVSSPGKASLVLASTDEEAERDDLRASFQSQLNQQSDAFRSTATQGVQPVGDSSRINVVNAPVVTGGK